MDCSLKKAWAANAVQIDWMTSTVVFTTGSIQPIAATGDTGGGSRVSPGGPSSGFHPRNRIEALIARQSQEQDPIHGRADGDDPAGGRPAGRPGGRQEARRERPDDLRLWKHFGTLEPADVKRLRQLEHENGRLKKMVADRDRELRRTQVHA